MATEHFSIAVSCKKSYHEKVCVCVEGGGGSSFIGLLYGSTGTHTENKCCTCAHGSNIMHRMHRFDRGRCRTGGGGSGHQSHPFGSPPNFLKREENLVHVHTKAQGVTVSSLGADAGEGGGGSRGSAPPPPPTFLEDPQTS